MSHVVKIKSLERSPRSRAFDDTIEDMMSAMCFGLHGLMMATRAADRSQCSCALTLVALYRYGSETGQTCASAGIVK